MDIHFCDLCGVRVTDVDLRGGHGIRKQYDVICATCLELGHGKEWLARHQRGKVATTASQPAAALASNTSNKQAPLITQARDRVRTYEDGDESPVVAPQVVAADEPEDGIATSELSTAEVAAEAAEAEAPSQAEANPFAAAASSFSALAAPSKKVDAAADVDEDAEKGEGLADESTSAPIIAGDVEAKADAGDSPFDYKEDGKKGASQKDETLPSDRDPLMVDKPADKKGSKQSSSGSAAFKKSGAGNKSSASNSKVGNKAARSGKSPAKKVNKNKNIMIMSAISLGILIMIGLFVKEAFKPARKDQQRIEIDLSENVKSAIKEAKFKATQALNSGGVKELEAARSQIQAIVTEINTFEKAAKGQKPPWTDEEMGQYLQNIGWTDLNSLNINIGQKIAKLKVGG
jgi:hypothetical protein